MTKLTLHKCSTSKMTKSTLFCDNTFDESSVIVMNNLTDMYDMDMCDIRMSEKATSKTNVISQCSEEKRAIERLCESPYWLTEEFIDTKKKHCHGETLVPERESYLPFYYNISFENENQNLDVHNYQFSRQDGNGCERAEQDIGDNQPEGKDSLTRKKHHEHFEKKQSNTMDSQCAQYSVAQQKLWGFGEVVKTSTSSCIEEGNRKKRVQRDGLKRKPKKRPWYTDLKSFLFMYVMYAYISKTMAIENKCKLYDRSIKMDADYSKLTFNICLDKKLCQGKIFRWDMNDKQIYLSVGKEKIGGKYDFHYNPRSGCVQMVIKNLTDEDFMAVYTFTHSFQPAKFEPQKQPIAVGEPLLYCDNGMLELRSMIKQGLIEIMKWQSFAEKERQIRQEAHAIIDVQDDNISVPINGSYTPCNFSVIYHYKMHSFVLLREYIGTGEIEKCEGAKGSSMPPESNNTKYMVIGVVFGLSVLVAITFLCFKNKVGCFKGLKGKSRIPCKIENGKKEEERESHIDPDESQIFKLTTNIF